MAVASPWLYEPEQRKHASPRGRTKEVHVLLIESDCKFLQYLGTALARDSFHVSGFVSASEAIAKLQQGFRPDAILIDAHMLGADIMATLTSVREICPSTPAVVISCVADPKQIVKAIKLGAADYILKPFSASDLKTVLNRCLDVFATVQDESQNHEFPISEDLSFVCANKRMCEIRSQSMTFARVDLPVLILGESGTGKEVLAQFIHKMSPRANRTFLKVNCAAMPAELLESELFGYEQGAFTGASRSKPGKFEICNNGTIFLDEIGEMPASLQAKLLQVLQDGSFARLGSRTTVQVDVRVIAATNIDIALAFQEKRFREDLYYRLNGFSVKLPPLRERKEEIPVLIRYFARKLTAKYAKSPITVSDRLLQACTEYPWPGNLRELENFMKRLLVLDDENIMMNELRAGRPAADAESASNDPQSGLKSMVSSLKGEAEKKAITLALERHDWLRKAVAAELQISYKALLYKIRQYDIVPSRKR